MPARQETILLASTIWLGQGTDETLLELEILAAAIP